MKRQPGLERLFGNDDNVNTFHNASMLLAGWLKVAVPRVKIPGHDVLIVESVISTLKG